MNDNFLGISVGNTHVRIGGFVEGKLHETLLARGQDASAVRVSIEQMWERLKDLEDPTILCASVNPPVSDKIVDWAKDQLGQVIHRVEQDYPVPIGRHLDPETLVGEDRLLNAAAAYDVLKQACVIVDAGTALTVDFVDGAGVFHGGAILPGARMMIKAMNVGTAQLPEVDLARPLEAVGHNTVEAMRTGVFHGIRGAVRELVEQYAGFAGMYPLVLATGGDAEFFFSDYELVERIVPDLTLLGLAVTLKVQRQAGDEEE
jgi:type III pantothenate kinase